MLISPYLLLERYVGTLQQLGQQEWVLIVYIVITGTVDQQEIVIPEIFQIMERTALAILHEIIAFDGQTHVALRIYGI